MTDKNIQMSQRSADNTGWDNLFPITKSGNIQGLSDILNDKTNTSAFVDTGWIKMSFSNGFYSSWNNDNIYARYIGTPNESKLLIDSQVNIQNDYGLIEDQTAVFLPTSVKNYYNGHLNRKVLVGWGGTGKLVNAVVTSDGLRFETANDGSPNTVPPFQIEVNM